MPTWSSDAADKKPQWHRLVSLQAISFETLSLGFEDDKSIADRVSLEKNTYRHGNDTHQ
jgi:hypothetical protein